MSLTILVIEELLKASDGFMKVQHYEHWLLGFKIAMFFVMFKLLQFFFGTPGGE